MFTKLTFKSLGFYFKISRVFQSLPFKYKVEFSDGRGSLYLIRGKAKYLLWILNSILVLAFAVNIWLSFIDGCFFSEISDPVRLALGFQFSLFFAVVLIQLLTVSLKMGQLALFFNSIFKFHRTYFDKVFGTSKIGLGKYEDFSQFVICLFVGCWFTVPLPFIGLFLLNPDHPRYLYHRIFYLPELKNYWTVALWFLVEFYTYTCAVGYFYFFFFLIVTSTNCLNFWLKVTRPRPQSVFHRGRKREMALQIFRSLRILNTLSNNCLSYLSWPGFLFLFVGSMSFGVYGCVKLHSAFDMPFFCMFPICAVGSIIVCAIFFTILGNTFDYSRDFILMWRSESRGKAETREIRPLVPFGTQVFNFFIIKRMGLLFTILVVSNITINAILLH